MKIGIALGSGGARGLAHIGVLKALKEHGIKISYISGSSMGALVGAMYACSQSIERLEQMSRDFTWRKMLRVFFPSLPKAGFVDGDNVEEMLRENLDMARFEELPIHLAVETTDVESGDLVTLKSGDLVRAVRGSISIPVIFRPTAINGQMLVDGGLVSPVPVKTVREMGADYVIAVNVLAKHKSWLKADQIKKAKTGQDENSGIRQLLARINLADKLPERKQKRTRDMGMLMVIAQTIGISISHMASYQLDVEKPDFLIEPDSSNINVYDFHRGEDVIPQAYELALRLLDETTIPD